MVKRQSNFLDKLDSLHQRIYNRYGVKNRDMIYSYFKKRGFSDINTDNLIPMYQPTYICKEDYPELMESLGYYRQIFESLFTIFYYGCYSDFIIFPIANVSGKITNFTIRMSCGTTRFVHSTIGYTNLFGEQTLKGSSKKHFIIVTEGIFDTITLSAMGIPSVATLGTSNAPRLNLEFLSDYRNVYILMDSDNAGFEASKSILARMAVVYNNEAFLIKLPNIRGLNKTDVNDYFLKFGDKFLPILMSYMAKASPADEIIDIDMEKQKQRGLRGYIERDSDKYDLRSVYASFYPQGYVKSKTNRYDKCLCPFHQDTNPILVIYKKTNTAKCFVCGEFCGPTHFVKKVMGFKSYNRAESALHSRFRDGLIKKNN